MSPSRLKNAVRLMLLVQHRSGFLQIYFGVTIATILIVRLFLPETWWSMVVPALLLGEYGTMGVFMVAAMRFFERSEGSTAALVVTPLRAWEHVLAMILAPSVVAVVAGLAVFAGIFGVDGRLFFLFMPLFLTTVLAGSIGLIVSSHYTEFTRFLLGAIPVVTVFSLPFLSYFDVTPRYTFVWLPWDAALYSFANVVGDELRPWLYVLLSLQLAVFAAIALVWAERVFRRRVRESVL